MSQLYNKNILCGARINRSLQQNAEKFVILSYLGHLREFVLEVLPNVVGRAALSLLLRQQNLIF